MENKTQQCPLCKEKVYTMNRYPNYICNTCIDTHGPKTMDGKKIEFGNIDVWGGFKSEIEGEISTQHICYINKVKCYADEARFGGIVIQPCLIKLT